MGLIVNAESEFEWRRRQALIDRIRPEDVPRFERLYERLKLRASSDYPEPALVHFSPEDIPSLQEWMRRRWQQEELRFELRVTRGRYEAKSGDRQQYELLLVALDD